MFTRRLWQGEMIHDMKKQAVRLESIDEKRTAIGRINSGSEVRKGMSGATFLGRIVDAKREEIEERKRRFSLGELSRRAPDSPPAKNFAESIRRKKPQDPVNVIAEVKRASPSRGMLWSQSEWAPAAIARCYEENGAAAISVLTDRRFFKGSLEDLEEVRNASSLPLLRKDFILDPYQIYEARCAGADAVLLIAAALETEKLKELLDVARALKMDCLVEVHETEEMDRLQGIEYKVVGINNRDLRDFSVDISRTERLRPLVPPEKVVVSESGLTNRASLERIAALGIDAALIGEALIRSPDMGAMLRELSR